MFLVVGQPGSEARLVADALHAHPDLVVAGRGDLLLPLAFLLQRVSEPTAARRLAAELIVGDKGFADGIGRYLSPDAVTEVLAEAPLRLGPLLVDLYGAVAEAADVQAAGTMLAVLANPVMNRVGLYEGDIRLIHVVRDARSVAASPYDRLSPVDIARRWDQANRLFRDRRGGDPNRYALIRTEDFLRRPGRVTAAVGPVLGIDAAEQHLPLTVSATAPSLDRETRRAVTEVAREGLFTFGYVPSRRSPRRAAILAWRRGRALRERRRRSVAHRHSQAWALQAPPPWAPASDAESVAPAACNICRWTGPGFTGQQHAESADCPQCGSIARERFCLHGLPPEGEGGRRRLLETAPRLHGTYATAMARWFDYTELEPAAAPPGTPLGHLVGLEALPDASADVIVSAHDLHAVPDPDAALAQFHRILSPEGMLLVQVPVLHAATSPLEAAATAAPGTARWAFGVDVTKRLEAAGFGAELLVSEEFVDLVKGGPDVRSRTTTSGELDLDGVLDAAAAVALTAVADRATARRRGWLPAVMFVTIRAEKG